jgi:hypothetical protein
LDGASSECGPKHGFDNYRKPRQSQRAYRASGLHRPAIFSAPFALSMFRPMKIANDVSAPESDELLSLVTAERHPGLIAALHGPDGARLGAELASLLRGRFKVRAPRRAVTRMARLKFLDEDEVVLLKDISSTGVRLLMESHPSTDLAALPRIALCVNTHTRNLELPVAFVRWCGMQGKHVDVGFRFVDPGPEHQDVVENLRNFLFNPR